MKKLIFSIFFFQFFTSFVLSQNWKELDSLGMEYYNKGDYKLALKYWDKGLTQAEIEYGKKDLAYASSLNHLGNIYIKTGQYDKAEPLYNEALKIRKEFLGEKHPDYASLLDNLGSLYDDIGQYDKAEPLYNEALKIRKEILGENHPDYAKSLNNLGGLYYEIGQYDKAEILYNESIKIRKDVLGEKHPDYAASLNNLAILYKEKGQFARAESNYKEALKIRKEILGEKHSDYAESLSNLALFYYYIGQYDKAEPLLKESLKIYKETLGENHIYYARTLNNLALLYNTMGQYDKAEPLYKEALKIIKEVLGEKHPFYARSLNNLSYIYRDIGQYDKAEQFLIDAINIYKEIRAEKHPDYARILNNLATLYSVMKQYDKAESLINEALIVLKEVVGDKNPNYAVTLRNLAVLYVATGKYNKAEPIFNETIKIYKEVLGETHPDYAATLRNLGDLYRDLKQFDKAEPILKESLQIYAEILGDKHPDYTKTLFSLAMLYDVSMKQEKAEKCFEEVCRNYLSLIDSYFPTLSEKEKSQFIKTLNDNFEIFYSFCLRRYEINNSLTSNIFALRIPSKGTILTSSTQLRDRIRKSGDEKLIELYDKLQTKKAEISKANSLTAEERQKKGLDLILLESEANGLEKELTKISETYRNEFEPKKLNWLSVKRSLKKDESAIEFLNFRYYDKRWTDTIYYIALIIRPEFEYPKLVKLCTEKQLGNILNANAESIESYAKNKDKSLKLYELIWKPMENNLLGVNKVFISPSGLINKVSFSALFTDDDKLLCDKYSFNYTGNLKEIALNKDQVKDVKSIDGFTASIFGGAKYDIDSAVVKEVVSKFIQGEEEVWSPPADMILKNAPSSKIVKWNYLPGTLKEADKIKSIFEKNNLKVNEYTGENANEDVLKSLNYKNSPTILHISTHGYFFPEPQKNYKETETSTFIASENPLFRSGLILAGANRVWTGGSEIDGVENGILTAYEVANMDLQNTELVVLSACETGLGDIKSGEGVYGLQRAFKVAGAKSIIMSLWKVPDKETVELMTLFYTNLLNGMTKHDAFISAQKEMRKKYSPYYWAAFVLNE